MRRRFLYEAPVADSVEVAVEAGIAATGGDNEAGGGMIYDPDDEGYII